MSNSAQINQHVKYHSDFHRIIKFTHIKKLSEMKKEDYFLLSVTFLGLGQVSSEVFSLQITVIGVL